MSDKTVIKFCHLGEIRRICCERRPTYAQLQLLACELFPSLSGRALRLTYRDQDDDHVTFTDDVELSEAYQLSRRLFVRVRVLSAPPDNSSQHKLEQPEHRTPAAIRAPIQLLCKTQAEREVAALTEQKRKTQAEREVAALTEQTRKTQAESEVAAISAEQKRLKALQLRELLCKARAKREMLSRNSAAQLEQLLLRKARAPARGEVSALEEQKRKTQAAHEVAALTAQVASARRFTEAKRQLETRLAEKLLRQAELQRETAQQQRLQAERAQVELVQAETQRQLAEVRDNCARLEKQLREQRAEQLVLSILAGLQFVDQRTATEHRRKLLQLHEMGFRDLRRAQLVLQNRDGDLEKTIEFLSSSA